MQNMLIKFHPYIRRGWIVLFLLIIGLPVVSWFAHAPLADAVGSSFFTFKLIGQITGIIGAQLFAFALILSARLAFIEKLFGGLDKLYVIHHRVGVIGFSLLAVHPIILAFRYVSDSLEDAAAFLSPIGNTMPITFGIASLLLMLALLFLTFYGSIFSYEKLKIAHQFLGLGFFLGFMHILFIPSSLNSDVVLKVSLVATGVVGLLAFSYRTLLGKWLVSKYQYKVTGVKDLGGQMIEISMQANPNRKKLYHLPGQFGMLSFPRVSFLPKEEHPFTISSAGVDGSLRFSIKALGDYTKTVALIGEGVDATIEGPFGEFSYLYGTTKQVWVAGGIGVTPFVSMAEYMLTQESIPYTVDFFYSSRSEADGVYKELFDAVMHKHPSFVFHFMPSDTKGFITGEVILGSALDLHSRDIFICGPPGLMAALTDQLIAIKVPFKNIRTERFALLK